MKKIILLIGVSTLILTLSNKVLKWYQTGWVQENLRLAYPTIEDSQKNGLLVQIYKVDSSVEQKYKIKEAWVENTWYEKVVEGEAKNIKTNELQLNIKFINEPDFGGYLKKWEIIEKNAHHPFDRYSGKFGNNYVYILKEFKNLPDTFFINLDLYKNRKYLGDKGTYCQFFFNKK